MTDGQKAGAADPEPARHPGTGSGTRLWLLRHAEVRADWQGVAYGDLDVPLSPEGEGDTAARARAFAALAPDAIWSSDLVRARALAEALAAEAGLTPHLEPGLREIHRGSWQGKRVDELHDAHSEEVAAFYRDPWSWRGHGGESDSMVLARALPVVEAALAACPTGGTLLVTTHYNVIRIVSGHLLGMDPARTFSLRVDPSRAVGWIDGPDGWVLTHSNVASPRAQDEDAGDPTHPLRWGHGAK